MVSKWQKTSTLNRLVIHITQLCLWRLHRITHQTWSLNVQFTIQCPIYPLILPFLREILLGVSLWKDFHRYSPQMPPVLKQNHLFEKCSTQKATCFSLESISNFFKALFSFLFFSLVTVSFCSSHVDCCKLTAKVVCGCKDLMKDIVLSCYCWESFTSQLLIWLMARSKVSWFSSLTRVLFKTKRELWPQQCWNNTVSSASGFHKAIKMFLHWALPDLLSVKK